MTRFHTCMACGAGQGAPHRSGCPAGTGMQDREAGLDARALTAQVAQLSAQLARLNGALERIATILEQTMELARARARDR